MGLSEKRDTQMTEVLQEFESKFRAFLSAQNLNSETKEDPFSPKSNTLTVPRDHRRIVSDFNNYCASSNNGVPISRASDPTKNETSDGTSYFGTPATNKAKCTHLKVSAQTSVKNPFSPAKGIEVE